MEDARVMRGKIVAVEKEVSNDMAIIAAKKANGKLTCYFVSHH